MSRNETESSSEKNATTDNLAQAVAVLKQGDIIVFPTETLYGLGADALNDAAVDKVFHLKGRDRDNPIPVLVADESMLLTLVAEISPAATKLMRCCWPGPLTLVLPARKGVPKPLVNSAGGIGVRISNHAIASQLVTALGRPLTATSANPSGKQAARTVMEARAYFTDQVKVFVDGGTLTSKTGSTVVELLGDSLKIIRGGEISLADLERILSEDGP